MNTSTTPAAEWDHSVCCDPERIRPITGAEWLWLDQLRRRGYAVWIANYRRDARGQADAVLAENPAVNAVALRWDARR